MARGAKAGIPAERSRAAVLAGAAASAVLDAADAGRRARHRPGEPRPRRLPRGDLRKRGRPHHSRRHYSGACCPRCRRAAGRDIPAAGFAGRLGCVRTSAGQARRIAKTLGAKLALVRAYQPVPPAAAAYPYLPPDIPQQMGEAAATYVKGKAEAGEHSVIVQGDAASGIVAAANDLDADLIVMSSHGKGFSRRFLVGSTTDRVMHEVHRPLLIIPRTVRSLPRTLRPDAAGIGPGCSLVRVSKHPRAVLLE